MQLHFNPHQPWELRATYKVAPTDLDSLNHVNNKVYLDWLEKLAWQHSLAVGIDELTNSKFGKLMVVVQHELNYHAAAHLDDHLSLKTWLNADEKRIGCCKRKRHYEITRDSDQKIIFSAHTIWACMNLTTQKAAKLPLEFIDPYFRQPETVK